MKLKRASITQTGFDFISVAAGTKSVNAIDLNLAIREVR